jgi:hypothetical protein
MRNTTHDNEPWTISKADGANGYTDVQQFDTKTDALAAIANANAQTTNGDAGYNAQPSKEALGLSTPTTAITEAMNNYSHED